MFNITNNKNVFWSHWGFIRKEEGESVTSENQYSILVSGETELAEDKWVENQQIQPSSRDSKLGRIRPCHKAAILPWGTKKALFYHAKPHPHGFHCEA